MPSRQDDYDFHSGFRRRRREDRKKRQLYILLAAGAVGLMTCCGGGGLVVYEVRRTVREIRKAHVPPEQREPVARLSAEDLVNAYKVNWAKADEKYTDEPVQVTGVVQAVENRPWGLVVTLRTGPGDARVRAEFEPGRADLARLRPGEPCTIVGVCEGRDDPAADDPNPGFRRPGAGTVWVVVLSSCRIAE